MRRSPASEFRPGVAILAAGRSRRMGQPKLLLPWSKTTVLGHIITQWQNLRVAQIAVVVASDRSDVPSELDRLGFSKSDRIPNPTPELGMFSSIQYAAAWQNWKPNLTHWVIALGDQPQLRPETLQVLLKFGARLAGKICQPALNGHRRHPVLFPKTAFHALCRTPAANLRQFLELRQNQLAEIKVNDPGLDLDIDTPADYRRAQLLALDRASCFFFTPVRSNASLLP